MSVPLLQILCFHEFWIQTVNAVTGPANKMLVVVFSGATSSLQPEEQIQDREMMARSRSLFIILSVQKKNNKMAASELT